MSSMDRKALAIEAIRALTVDGKPPSARQYTAQRVDWMPSFSSIRNWFGSWSTACRAAAGEQMQADDDELDVIAGDGDFTGIDKSLMRGWWEGCHIVWNPSTKREYKFYDTSTRRWVQTWRYNGAMTV